MLSQKYIKSKLDCIEDKLCNIEKLSSQSNNTLTNIDNNTNSYIADKIEFTVLVNPTGQSYSTFKEILFQVLTGNINVLLTEDNATFATTGNYAPAIGFLLNVTADNPGIIGNSISLTPDGVSTMEVLVANWNAANPTNTATVTYTTGTAYIPGALEIIPALTGGGGIVSSLSFHLLGTHGNINGDTFSCDTESNFTVSFAGTGQVYIRVKKQ